MLHNILNIRTLSEKLYFINDYNQKKRWIFPTTLQSPTFLNLYNSNTVKGYIYKIFIYIVFKFRLQKFFVSGTMQKDLNIKYKSILKQLECPNYSIFTGTPGENRKIVIEANDEKKTKYFIKVPTTKSAKELVQKEKINLEFLKQFSFNTFDIPSVAFSDEEVVVISNVKPQKIAKCDNFSNIHFRALDELYDKTAKKSKLSQVNTISQSLKYIEDLEKVKFNLNNELDINIQKLTLFLSESKKYIITQSDIVVSFSHKDFTPWNMYCTKHKLYVYDWELACDETPLLFDFFHYIFQKGVLVKHKSYKKIKEEISISQKNKFLQEILDRYEVDINHCYGYYLMINISYYALKYFYQKELHTQAYWLIDVWNDALDDFIEKKGRPFDK